jgi:molybdenum cofactor cytidylyltransferase
MGHSLAAGIEQIQSWDYVFVGLADMPFIKTRSLKTLNEAITDNTQIIQPTYKRENGHPVGFGSAYFEELMALSGDKGARSIVRQYPQQVTTINLNDSGLIRDIDTPDQLLDKFA